MIDLTTTVHGVTYCNYCTKQLQNGEACDCEASKRALAKAAKKEASKNMPKHNEKPPRKQK